MVQLGFSVSPIRLTGNRPHQFSCTFFHSPQRSPVFFPVVKKLPGFGCQSRICSFTAKTDAATDASKLQGEDWGSQDFSHTDWDHEVPLVKGTPKKGAIIGLVSLLVLAWGAVESFNALGACRIAPQSPDEPPPAVSKVQTSDDMSSRDAEFYAIRSPSSPKENPDLDAQSVLDEDIHLSSSMSALDVVEAADDAPSTPEADDAPSTPEANDAREDFSTISTDVEQNDMTEDMQESTSSIEVVPFTEMDPEIAEDTDSVNISEELNNESEGLAEHGIDTTLSESTQYNSALVAEDPSTSRDGDLASEPSSKYEMDNISDAEIEELARGMSLESLRQRALLAARAASAASNSARQAAACSSSASAAAAMAVSAAERATAASGAAQAAMEFGTKTEVIKAERRAVEAAQIASEAERRAASAASTAQSSKDAAGQQAQMAEDLSTLRQLRGSTIIENIRENGPIVWESTVSASRNALTAIWQWLTSLWDSMCMSWPWLTNLGSNAFLKVNQVVGDVSWRFREVAGSVGDFFDRVMSNWATVSKAIGAWVTSVFGGIWSSIQEFCNAVAAFFQDLISKLRSGLNSR